jgi:hypothetical protein
MSDTLFTCAEDGGVTSHFGGRYGADYVPSDSHIFAGSVLPTTLDPQEFPAQGVAYVHDDAGVVCNSDVALILLDRPLDAGVAPIRLDGEVDASEQLSVVGWGATTTDALPTRRQRRDDVGLVDVGPSSTVRVGGELGPNEFIATESACFGDSGGPAFDATTGAIVGVISRGAQGSTTANGSGCLNTQHTFMKTAPFAALVHQAFSQTGGQPLLEGADSADAGQPDAGPVDAGAPDVSPGAPDGGVMDGTPPTGCRCGVADGPVGIFGTVVMAVAYRRRRARSAL